MNKYHSFYLDDIERIVIKESMFMMRSPATMATNGIDVQQHNDRIAFFNDGIRKMTTQIIEDLRKIAEEGSTDE